VGEVRGGVKWFSFIEWWGQVRTWRCIMGKKVGFNMAAPLTRMLFLY